MNINVVNIAFVLALNTIATAVPLVAWAQENSEQKIVFVSPQGSDTAASSSQTQTYRTITAAIAANPQEGVVFQLDAGTYGENTGETFPIRLSRGAVLRGNPNGNGADVIISGGGRFVSSTFASQNIAIAAANNSRIEGVTVTNTNPRGYGLWLESSRNVVIANNKFIRSTHDGIFLTGSANAYIGNNLFMGNTGSGISAVGTSTGEIRDNQFENTGFGLSIGQQSRVVLINNQITRNVDGLIISNAAQPILRGNAIADNQRNGLVVLSDANGSPRPDLGTTTSLGANIFRNNREFDINNTTTIPLIAVGNQITRSRVKGLLDFNASSSSITSAANPNPTIPIQRPVPTSVFVPAKPPLQSLPSPVISTNPNTSSNNSPTIITIERAYNGSSANPRLLNQVAALPPVTLDPLTGKPFQYRVIVPISTTAVTERVKTIVPDAFRALRNGRNVLQVGAYSDRPAADELVQKLALSGVSAEIIPFR